MISARMQIRTLSAHHHISREFVLSTVASGMLIRDKYTLKCLINFFLYFGKVVLRQCPWLKVLYKLNGSELNKCRRPGRLLAWWCTTMFTTFV